MKKYIYIVLFSFLYVQAYSQIFNYNEIICGVSENTTFNQQASSTRFSGNGSAFTPKGDLRVLIICAGFGPQYDNSFSIGDWNAASDSLPRRLLDKSTIYSDTLDFTTYANANHNRNLSRFYYEMSHHKFRLTADVYPKRINIDATGATSFAQLNGRVLEKMKQENPGFNWSKYDLHKNIPDYLEDASMSAPDNKPDYIVIVYRYSNDMPNKPVSNMSNWVGSGGGYAACDGVSGINYNGYTFNSGFTHCSYSPDFYTLFVHEVAHTLYDCPHYGYANGRVGNYFYGKIGWGVMNASDALNTFNCVLGWEKWYLDWVESIKANGTNSDIKSASDLNASGEYTLRDFLTTGDMIRIKIPNTGGRNQYLWIENHQGISVFDAYLSFKDGCDTPFPTCPKGVIAYIESINDDRTNPGSTFSYANAIKWFHPKGNFDYGFDTPYLTQCTWNNYTSNFIEIAPNPLGGQSRAEVIREDFDSNGSIILSTGTNDNAIKNEGYRVWKRNNVFTYDFLGHEITFSQGQQLSMSSNPCLTNMPTYNESTKKMGAFILNGISVKVMSYTSGNAKIKIVFNDVAITNNTRYTGLIHLPNITQNTNPDIIIQSGVTLSIDKSGTPNRHTKTSTNDFINPTEFYCLSGSFFKQEENSVVNVENGSTLVMMGNSTYEINENAKLRIKAGSCLQIKQGATLNIKNSGEIIIEDGAYICVEAGVNINLQHFNSAINLYENAILGNSPNTSSSANCISSVSGITKTGLGTINRLNQNVYIQNEMITINCYIAGKNIYIGNHVTTSKPQGDVTISNNANVFFKASENVYFEPGFECVLGSAFEVVKQ